MKTRWKKALIASIVIAIILIFIIFGIINKDHEQASVQSGDSIEVQKVAERQVSETILVTGEVVPEAEQKVYLEPEKGAIKEIKVKENMEVKAGTPLFSYDSSEIEAEINQALREKKSIENRAQMLQNQIAMLDMQIAEAKKNGEPKEAVRQLELEKQQLAIEHEGTIADIEAVQDTIQSLNERKKDQTITSKIDGIVVKVNEHATSSDSGGNEPIVHIVSNKPFKVVGTLSEFDAVKIKKDQEVIVRPKVYKDREWKGKVESISQFPSEDGMSEEEMYFGGGTNVTMYPFTVVLTDDTSDLRQGFHVSLEVSLGSGNKLAVPFSAVVKEGDKQFVYILKDNVLEKREIETGLVGEEYVEVKKGVKKNELVIVSPSEEMVDGMEVTSFVEVE